MKIYFGAGTALAMQALKITERESPLRGADNKLLYPYGEYEENRRERMKAIRQVMLTGLPYESLALRHQP